MKYLILVLLISCGRSKTTRNFVLYNANKFDGLNVESSKKIINEIFIPNLIDIVNNQLIINDPLNENHYFYLYDKGSLGFIEKFGVPGKGPNEYESSAMLTQQKNIKNNTLNVLMLRNMELIKISLSSKKNGTYEKNFSPLPPECNNSNYVVESEKTIIFDHYDLEFGIYNKEKNLVTQKNFLTDLYNQSKIKKINNENLSTLRQNKIKIKPDRSKFVVAYHTSPEINIFDPEGNLLTTIYPDDHETTLDPNIDGDSPFYSNNLYLTDNFIYVLNKDCKISKAINDECDNNYILIFDWKGSLINKINLNHHLIISGSFAVDESNKTIYSIADIEDEYAILKFKY